MYRHHGAKAELVDPETPDAFLQLTSQPKIPILEV